MKYDIKITDFGTNFYYKTGTDILHREDGPAIERPNGDKAWYQNNRLHRLDGAAVEYADNFKQYFINGTEYFEKEYWYIVKNNLYVLL